MAYLDNIIIFSYNKEHLRHIETIFQKLKAAGLKLKESKCDFFQKGNSLLGSFNFRSGYPPSARKIRVFGICHDLGILKKKTISRFNWLPHFQTFLDH